MVKALKFKQKGLISEDNKGKELGAITYNYSVLENGKEDNHPTIVHLQFFSTNNIQKLTTPTLVKDVITVILELFNNEAWLIEWIIHKDNPAKAACRAFCDVMGGRKSDKIFFASIDRRDETIWEEYMICRDDFLEKNFTGSIDDMVKIIAAKTNKLKRKYKNPENYL